MRDLKHGQFLVIHDNGEGHSISIPFETFGEAVQEAISNTYGGQPFIVKYVDVRTQIEEAAKQAAVAARIEDLQRMVEQYEESE